MSGTRLRSSSDSMNVSPEDLHQWLNNWPSVNSQLNLITIGLRRRQLIGSRPCSKATLEILRSVLGTCKFQSTNQMMNVVRAVGRELTTAAPSELTVGNVVRRVLFMIREEYAQKLATLSAEPAALSAASQSQARIRGGSQDSSGLGGNNTDSNPSSPRVLTTTSSTTSNTTSNTTSTTTSTTASHPSPPGSKHVKITATTTTGTTGTTGTGAGATSAHKPTTADVTSTQSSSLSPTLTNRMENVSLSSVVSSGCGGGLSALLSQGLTSPRIGIEGGDLSAGQQRDASFARYFPDMRQAVMAAINELNEELDNVYGPICEQAQENIHNDECVLVFGHSTTVELFLKAAGRKRRFQVVVAEAAPSLDGHKLAVSLSKVPNIAVTLIPDSGVYAIMSRVNKVIISPQAVVADGGAICPCGHLMVATAAKEFSVPVVGVTGVSKLTPLFAHNQGTALDQLVSPATAIAYNAPVNFDNVEVRVPAFDLVPPDLIDLYVTNNGSHQPSYMYRLLAEYYHPNDHVL